MTWTEKTLTTLPTQQDCRLRGHGMTRLEAFTDAAFAFAITMLVISVGKIPGNTHELLTALKAIPTCAVSIAFIMWFWTGHWKWSRRYGLEDGWSMFFSILLVFVMLIYVYPLRLMVSAGFFTFSNGYFPTDFIVQDISEMPQLFVVYGLGFAAFAATLVLLNRRALKLSKTLRLNTAEILRTKEEVANWTVVFLTALLSAAYAWLMPLSLGIWAGFIYCSFPITLPAVGIYYEKKIEAITTSEK
ncbi:MAG: TMEM175 family protein [Planctomycetota bacterium]|nr:TMEM175 family protein [Planctomycetota bacterium]